MVEDGTDNIIPNYAEGRFQNFLNVALLLICFTIDRSLKQYAMRQFIEDCNVNLRYRQVLNGTNSTKDQCISSILADIYDDNQSCSGSLAKCGQWNWPEEMGELRELLNFFQQLFPHASETMTSLYTVLFSVFNTIDLFING